VAEKKSIRIVARHIRGKSPLPSYRRAGIVLGMTDAEYEVTEEQLAALKADKLVKLAVKTEAKASGKDEKK